MYSFALTSTTEYTERQSNKWLEKQLAAIAQENKQALAVLYKNTKAAVYGFALSILKNPYDAEDVLQDVYVCIYQSASRYHAQGKPMAWIFTITKNLSYLKLRDTKKTADLSDDAWEQFCAPESTHPSEDKLLLQNALQHLTDEERQILFLHSTAGLRHREIASYLELGLSTVLSKYHRSLKKLKKLLAEDDTDEK